MKRRSTIILRCSTSQKTILKKKCNCLHAFICPVCLREKAIVVHLCPRLAQMQINSMLSRMYVGVVITSVAAALSYIMSRQLQFTLCLSLETLVVTEVLQNRASVNSPSPSNSFLLYHTTYVTIAANT
jgi:hypothetical protein